MRTYELMKTVKMHGMPLLSFSLQLLCCFFFLAVQQALSTQVSGAVGKQQHMLGGLIETNKQEVSPCAKPCISVQYCSITLITGLIEYKIDEGAVYWLNKQIIHKIFGA